MVLCRYLCKNYQWPLGWPIPHAKPSGHRIISYILTRDIAEAALSDSNYYQTRMFFGYDGEPAHFNLNVQYSLNATFLRRLIGRSGFISWPLRSHVFEIFSVSPYEKLNLRMPPLTLIWISSLESLLLPAISGCLCKCASVPYSQVWNLH